MLATALSLPASILAGAAIGWIVDRYMFTAPIGIAVGAIAGTCAGLWKILFLAKQLDRR